ncbi:MAG: helix-turn-helix domain-containing protein [Spirochaetales bacterium]|nr:helix-turn-helix domain-containing protein [Spirochaetales bacterium]
MKKPAFYRSIPYRYFILDLTSAPYPQVNGDEWSIHNMTMNDYDLFICLEGAALFTMDETEYLLQPGRALLVPPGRLINARKTSEEPVRMLAQHFMFYIFNRSDFFSLIRYSPLVELPDWGFLSGIYSEIARICGRVREEWSPLDTSPLFRVLLNAFIEEAYLEEDFREERMSSLVLTMIQTIEEEYRDPDLLEKLIAESSYGYSHTVNTFKEYTGRSLKSFIIERRLEASKGVLLKGGSLRESAEAAGYSDEFYYSRIFKKYTGIPPREFRKRI